MARFIATCPHGLVDALATELKEMDLNVIETQAGGVLFDSNWEGCYKANLCSRLASRILKPVLDFTAYQPEELYGQILNHDFTKYIKPNQTLTIDDN
jgi:23S rRNA G2445 N2-methylase RlmL